MRIVSIVGARPQFVKLAPVSRAMSDSSVTGGIKIEDIIVHTGQHYDAGMSDVFFDELNIPKPNVNLEIGSGSHGVQSARMLEGIENILIEERPDMLVVYGDTNSTLAGAIAASKLCIPIAHIEAGLRSFNRSMPEEINRIVADHVSDLLFAPTETAMVNLADEGLGKKAVNTGDVMLDAVIYNSALAEQNSSILTSLGIEREAYAVVTLHRASNTEEAALFDILDTLNEVAATKIPIVFPAHPRTLAMLKSSERDWRPHPSLNVIDPVGYLDMLKLIGNAGMVLTDSGGLQKEALFVGVPCVTLRSETEWTETVQSGANILSGKERVDVLAAVERWLDAGPGVRNVLRDGSRHFGDGRASESIVAKILSYQAVVSP